MFPEEIMTFYSFCFSKVKKAKNAKVACLSPEEDAES